MLLIPIHECIPVLPKRSVKIRSASIRKFLTIPFICVAKICHAPPPSQITPIHKYPPILLLLIARGFSHFLTTDDAG
ncbi:MAG: hypothetical protein LH613_00870 [Chamaesiphon sp.]|nr:hypothetical protein [Chamaesiphon sp.]